MKARRLRLFAASMKMSKRFCDYSHYQLTIWDRVVIYFSTIEWVRSLSGKPVPIIRGKKWTYYFAPVQRAA